MELEDRDVERSTACVIASAALRAYGAALLVLGLCGLLAWCVASFEPNHSGFAAGYERHWLLALPLTQSCAGVWLMRHGARALHEDRRASVRPSRPGGERGREVVRAWSRWNSGSTAREPRHPMPS